MSIGILAAISLLVFPLSVRLTHWLWSAPSFFYILDTPNERSLHSDPIPRTGGIAVITSAMVGISAVALVYGAWRDVQLLVLATLVIAVVSFLDDRRGVHPLYRLIVHFAGAALLLREGWTPSELHALGEIEPWLPELLVLVFAVWMTNLYNFMDGMDGFAGGMGVIGFASLALLGVIAGAGLFAAVNLTICVAAAGFLIFNFPPARIFLGDVGSSALGFLAAASSLWGSQRHLFPLWVPLLVFSPFIVDSTVTLVRRLVKGEKVWQAHKTHFYQRLVQLGWGHRKTVLAEYMLMFACSLSAVFGAHRVPNVQLLIVISWAIVYVLLMLLVNGLEAKTKQHEGNVS